MVIVETTCPSCEATFIVDRALWAIGTIALRCPGCQAYFLPADSPGEGTAEEAARSSVPLTIWRPGEGSGPPGES